MKRTPDHRIIDDREFLHFCIARDATKLGFLGQDATSWDFWNGMRKAGNSWENLGRNATNNVL